MQYIDVINVLQFQKECQSANFSATQIVAV